MKLSLLAGSLAWAVGAVEAASTFKPARPPAIPLAVKSPYLNTILEAGSTNGGTLAGKWAQHWSESTTAIAGYIRVDNTTYEFAGRPNDGVQGPGVVDQTAFEYTSTRSIFTQTAGPVQLKTTFLSPIYPTDLRRGSLVASYIEAEATSMDGKPHDVQLYMDISGEWASGDSSNMIDWSHGTAGTASYHKFQRSTQQEFTEHSDRAEWGNWYFTTTEGKRQTYQIGADHDVRTQFVNNGVLTGDIDTNFRAISDRYPVFAYTHDLGSVGSTPTSRVFTVQLYQDRAIQFIGLDPDVQQLASLWKTYFQTAEDGVSFFQGDYSTASTQADSLDQKIATDSKNAGGDDYATITTLAVRQAYGAMQLVGDFDNQLVFLKEISSDGNVNTVDVSFPSSPVLAYLNPTWVKWLIDPLFQNQEGGHYPNKWAMHDLGSSYPNATGHPDGRDEAMPLEECGNMLIMTLLYAQKASDTAYLSKHYNLLKQWTQYLVDEALYPANQISTDDFAGALANQSNLAIKGMLGIGAMSQIANLTGNTDDAANYLNISQSYIKQWQTLAFNMDASPPHSKLSYNEADSWGNLYNLYADKLLGLNLVPQSVYDTIDNFYPTVMNDYGLPLDTRSTQAKGDWEMWLAAFSSDKVKSMLISKLATWINATSTARPFSDLYDTITGSYPAGGPVFNARPVVGGMFALLALNH